MYCPSCGTELTPELSYCNRCGANLKPISNQSGVPPTKLIRAAWAISMAVALVTLGGFGMIFGLVMALITRGLSLSAEGMVLIFFSSLVILAIDWLLVRQLSHLSLCVSAQTCELYVPLRLTQIHVAHQFAEQPVRSASAS